MSREHYLMTGGFRPFYYRLEGLCHRQRDYRPESIGAGVCVRRIGKHFYCFIYAEDSDLSKMKREVSRLERVEESVSLAQRRWLDTV